MSRYNERAEILPAGAATEWNYRNVYVTFPFSVREIPAGAAIAYEQYRDQALAQIIAPLGNAAQWRATMAPRVNWFLSKTTSAGTAFRLTRPGGLAVGSPLSGTFTIAPASGDPFEIPFSGTLARWIDGDGFYLFRTTEIDLSNVPASGQQNYFGGRMSLALGGDVVDPLVGPIWIGVSQEDALSVELAAAGVVGERAVVVTRWRPNSPIARQLRWRGEEWTVQAVTVPDRWRSMKLTLARDAPGV